MTEPVDLIDGVPLHSLKRYLVANGWKRRALSSGNLLFSTAPEGEDVEILLPETSHVRNLRDLLESAVMTLSALERRTPVDVVAAVPCHQLRLGAVEAPGQSDPLRHHPSRGRRGVHQADD